MPPRLAPPEPPPGPGADLVLPCAHTLVVEVHPWGTLARCVGTP